MAVTVKVVDLSHHNVVSPDGFKKMADYGVRGVIHKASQGTRMVDPQYARRRDDALSAGLLWGAYHFATGDNPIDQVAHFVKTAAPDETTLMVLDHEPYNGNQLNLRGAKVFLETLEEQIGLPPAIYSGNLIKEQTQANGSLNDFFSGYRLWLCQYGPRAVLPAPWSEYFLWQFSGDGVANRGFNVPGIVGGNKVDMNTFDGTDEELAARWAAG